MPGGTRQAGATPKGGPEKTGKVREQQGRLETLRTLKHRVKTLKKGNSGATLEPEVRNVSQRHLHTRKHSTVCLDVQRNVIHHTWN